MANIMDNARVKVMTSIKIVKVNCWKYRGIIDGGKGRRGISRVICTVACGREQLVSLGTNSCPVGMFTSIFIETLNPEISIRYGVSISTSSCHDLWRNMKHEHVPRIPIYPF